MISFSYYSSYDNSRSLVEQEITLVLGLENSPSSKHIVVTVVIDYGLRISLVNSIPKPWWNFQQADWRQCANMLPRSHCTVYTFSHEQLRLICGSCQSSCKKAYY